MRINPFSYAVLVLAVFLGVIWGFQAAGVWSVSGKLSNDGEAILPVASDVNTIKGWMTLEQISTVYNVPIAEILAQFELPADAAPATALKDLETDLFSVTGLREWLQSRSEPVAPVGATPDSTLQPTEPPVQLPPTSQATPVPAQVEPTAAPAATEHVAPARTITGKTTFQELLDWGLSEDAIRQIIGGELPALSTVIKDYLTGKGLEFSPIKTALQAEIDKIP